MLRSPIVSLSVSVFVSVSMSLVSLCLDHEVAARVSVVVIRVCVSLHVKTYVCFCLFRTMSIDTHLTLLSGPIIEDRHAC